MKKEQRTAAEQQIEALRLLKQTQAKRRPVAAPGARAAAPAEKPAAAPATASAPFELSENVGASAPRKTGPSLPVSAATWRRLRERQRQHHEFRRRRDMGDWAAELLLALPPGVAGMGEAARADLFDQLQKWAKARGL
jgi:hypothetical protein